MYSRKRHDRTSRNAKEADIQLSGLSLLISQDSSASPSHKTKQSPSKSTSKSQPSKTSPRRRPQTRTDIKSNHTSTQRHQSPSPSRTSSRTSSSPVPVSNSCFRTKSEDGATASVSSSPVSGGPSGNRSSWTPTRKLSARSRTSDSQSGKSKVTVRHTDNGKILVKRSSEEKCNDPDRLLMDRCNLTVFPLIEGEERLRLLNLKHNEIKKIENLFSFSFLMFLDLSDNCIDSISSLDCLPSLRILMLARNRIKQIQGLEELPHLDVLDLSGNEIKEIENVSHLKELRVLNLAGNQLSHLSCLKGLDSLVELNVSKNLLTVLEEVDQLPRLQRFFVAQNNIERLEDMMCVVNITSLAELTLEGCPVTQRNHYRYFILFRLPHLKFLDMRRVLDEEKRTAQIIMRKEEMKRQEGIRIAKLKEAREKAIVNARHYWEESGDKDQRSSAGQPEPSSDTPFLHASALPLQLLAARTFSTFSEEEEDCSLCERSFLPCEYCSGSKQRPASGKSTKSQKAKKKQSKRSHESLRAKKSKSPSLTEHELTDSRLTYLAEVEDDTLQLYGPGAVAAAIGNSWHPQIISLVRTVSFHFIVYDSISHLLSKLKDQFPNLAGVTFECTNIQTFAQLNALGEIMGLQSLMISTEGNPLVELPLWRSYAIYRLSPSISFINGTMVAEYERMKAEEMFGGLGTAVSTLLPKFRLSSLLNSSRVMQLYLSEKGYSPNSLQRQPDSQMASEVLKAALIYNPDFESKLPVYNALGRKMLEKAAMCVEEKVRKRVVFQRQWPSMFLGIVNDALEDYADLSRHMKLSMQSLLKRCKTLSENNQKD